MLRDSHRPWWLRMFAAAAVPAYVATRPPEALNCPACQARYALRDRYCPACHELTPEWRFG